MLCGAAWYIHAAQSSFEKGVFSNIERQRTLVADLATITDSNGADEITAAVISDCPNRIEFENYLGRLNSLSKKDLLTTQQLFNSCGSFYAERKALMVSRLEREYAVLVDNITLLEALHDVDAATRKTLRFKELIDFEKNRSSSLTDQTRIQSEIISLLIAGSSGANARITVLLDQAQEIAQSLGVLNKQIDDLRGELVQ